MSNLFRHLPSVDSILSRLEAAPEGTCQPRVLVRAQVNRFLDRCRQRIADGTITRPEELSPDALWPELLHMVKQGVQPHFRPVINATGVVLHTNLGRALLAPQARAAVAGACEQYCNLEFSLETGERGSRYSHVEELLCLLTGAQAAVVVNNNAAAVLLMLDTLAREKEVIVSRGQLVEIGGSFRIPDVMSKSGACLKEVGTTNRTHQQDYAAAITEQTSALLRVHCSNFRLVGFTREVSRAELVELGRRHDLAVLEDMGSGMLWDLSGYGFDEATVAAALGEGVDVVSFSGDKVLGGPQAGILAGKKKYIDAMKANPLTRALRIDKMTLAALEATLRLYLQADTVRETVPVLSMLTADAAILRKNARALKRRLDKALPGLIKTQLKAGLSRAGGGAFPQTDLPTTLVTVDPVADMPAHVLKEKLLRTDPPVAARIENECVCFDVRTLTKQDASCLVRAVQRVLMSS